MLRWHGGHLTPHARLSFGHPYVLWAPTLSPFFPTLTEPKIILLVFAFHDPSHSKSHPFVSHKHWTPPITWHVTCHSLQNTLLWPSQLYIWATPITPISPQPDSATKKKKNLTTHLVFRVQNRQKTHHLKHSFSKKFSYSHLNF